MKLHDQPPERSFAYRVIASGMIESFCMSCFLTVCRCRTEEDLEKEEAEHVCQDDPNPVPVLFL
jgi:hypothetical protein